MYGAAPDVPAERGSPLTTQRTWWHRRPAPSWPPPTGCRRVTLPFYGFLLDADDDHRRRVDAWFQVPMLVLSLLVLPILVVHYYVSPDTRLAYLIDVGLLVISLAFLVELIIKLTIARSRAQYCLKNWLDVVIVVLPFLRPFRAARAARVLQLSRAYTFRGIYMKLARTSVGFVLGTEFARRLKERYAHEDAQTPAPPDYRHWSHAALISEIERLSEELKRLKGELKELSRGTSAGSTALPDARRQDGTRKEAGPGTGI